MHKIKSKAFTLVELIVVITILAILGTIAFISLQGYSQSARNSLRVNDMKIVQKALELFALQVGSYPDPDNRELVTTNSGSVINLWNLGEIGEVVRQNMGRISKIPKDPLTGVGIGYATTLNKREYELRYDLELAQQKTLTSQSYAAAGDVLPYILGNYNGLFLLAANNTYYAVPSLHTDERDFVGTGTGEFFMNEKIITYEPTPITHSGVILTSSNLKDNYINFGLGLKTIYAAIPSIASNGTYATVSNLTESTAAAFALNITGGKSSVVIPQSSTVSGACTGIVTNAIYQNSSTIQNVSGAPEGTSLVASYAVAPLTNTCEFSCDSGYGWTGSSCDLEYSYTGPDTGMNFMNIWNSIPNGSDVYLFKGIYATKVEKTFDIALSWGQTTPITLGYEATNNAGQTWTSYSGTAGQTYLNTDANNGNLYMNGATGCSLGNHQISTAGALCDKINGPGLGTDWSMTNIIPYIPVNGECSGLVSNASYPNNTTEQTLINAISGTSLIANYLISPSSNTCEFSCNAGYAWNGSSCTTNISYTGPDTANNFMNTWNSISIGSEVYLSKGTYATKVVKTGNISLTWGQTNPISMNYEATNDSGVTWVPFVGASNGLTYLRTASNNGDIFLNGAFGCSGGNGHQIAYLGGLCNQITLAGTDIGFDWSMSLISPF